MVWEMWSVYGRECICERNVIECIWYEIWCGMVWNGVKIWSVVYDGVRRKRVCYKSDWIYARPHIRGIRVESKWILIIIPFRYPNERKYKITRKYINETIKKYYTKKPYWIYIYLCIIIILLSLFIVEIYRNFFSILLL